MTAEGDAGGFLIVDIGKSGSRGRLRLPVSERGATEGGVGPETAGGARGGEVLNGVLERLWGILTVDGVFERESVHTLIVGSTALPDQEGIRQFLYSTQRGWPAAHVVFTEDGVLAHASALGEPGVVASIGTGTIVTGLTSAGSWYRLDGWGPDLGDRGGAAWLGTEGLRAAFSALDGVGPATSLLLRAREHLGATDLRTATTLLADPQRVRILAGFGAQVCAASEGDAVAADLLARATQASAATIARMADEVAQVRVATVGRLADNPSYRASLHEQLESHGLDLVDSRGGMLDVSPDTMFLAPYAAACHILRPERAR